MQPFDLSKVIKDANTGMVKTGQYTEVNEKYLGEAGYQQALSYAQQQQKPAVQQTTTQMRAEANANGATLDNFMQQGAAGQQQQDEKKPTTTEKKDPLDFTGDPRVQAIEDRAKADIASVNQQLDAMQRYFDVVHNQMVESVKATFGARIQEMEQTNRRTEKTATQVGIRAGRQRYAPVLHESIMADEERAGIERISKLEAQMLQGIAAANAARASQNLEVFNTRMKELDKVYKNMQTEIQDLYNTTLKVESERRAQRKEAADAEQQEFNNMLKTSERSAPAVLNALAQFKTDKEKVDFIEEYAKKAGIDVAVLWGDVMSASSAQQKEALNMRNIESQINARMGNLDVARQREARLAAGGIDDEIGAGGGTTTTYSLPLTVQIATEFEKAGMTTEDLIQLQLILNTGYSPDDIIGNVKLTPKQQELVKKYAVPGSASGGSGIK